MYDTNQNLLKTKTKGRVKGVPNKVTTQFRQAVTDIIEGNAHKVEAWLNEVAEGNEAKELKADPGKALDLFIKLAEFAAPKLARTEVVGDDGGPVKHDVNWVVNPVKPLVIEDNANT